MPGDKEDVAPPSCLSSEIGSRVESVHVDLIALTKPARDQGYHNGETGRDKDDKDCPDMETHIVVFQKDDPTGELLVRTVSMGMTDYRSALFQVKLLSLTMNDTFPSLFRARSLFSLCCRVETVPVTDV
jgi:hypothetical protein